MNLRVLCCRRQVRCRWEALAYYFSVGVLAERVEGGGEVL
jgi:hypothetical protein